MQFVEVSPSTVYFNHILDIVSYDEKVVKIIKNDAKRARNLLEQHKNKNVLLHVLLKILNGAKVDASIFRAACEFYGQGEEIWEMVYCCAMHDADLTGIPSVVAADRSVIYYSHGSDELAQYERTLPFTSLLR